MTRPGATFRLTGKDVAVRPWVAGDLDRASRWPDCKDLGRMDAGARDAYFQRMNAREGCVHFAVEDSAGSLIGLLGVEDMHEGERVAYNMLSRFDPKADASGLAREALRLVLGWCFGELGLVKVCAVIPVTDERGLERHLACGFEKVWEFWQPAREPMSGPCKQPVLDRALSYLRGEREKTYVKCVVLEASALRDGVRPSPPSGCTDA